MANWREVKDSPYRLFEKNTESYYIAIDTTDKINQYYLTVTIKSVEKTVYSTVISCEKGGIKAIKEMANRCIEEFARVNIRRLNELLN